MPVAGRHATRGDAAHMPDGPVAVVDQHGEHRSLLGRAEGHQCAVDAHLQRSENPPNPTPVMGLYGYARIYIA